jgi:hypothetical protein
MASLAEHLRAMFLEKRTPNYPDRVSADMPQPFPWRPTPPFRE